MPISDVRDLVKALSTLGKDASGMGKNARDLMINPNGNSIKQRSKNSILQFPLLVSDGVSKESMTLISKALEHDYASFVRIAMGLEDVIDLKKGKTDFIKKFHTNVNMRQFAEQAVVINKEQLMTLEQDLNSGNLNEMTVTDMRLSEAPLAVEYGDDAHGATRDQLNRRNIGPKGIRFTDNEIKKANELVPTLMEIDVQYMTPNGNIESTTIILGIKAVVHPVASNEMAYFVGRSLKENSLIFRAIQFTTGEIKFFKDLVLNLDRIKDETNYNERTSSLWWRKLRSMATSNRFRRLFNSKEKFIPTSTLVLTIDEVESINNTQGIDLLKDRQQVSKLMGIFFLMGFVVMDDIDEVAYVFDEENNTFRHISYSALKKEKSGGNTDLKTLVSLFSR